MRVDEVPYSTTTFSQERVEVIDIDPGVVRDAINDAVKRVRRAG
jgi:hypothetical protein